MNDKLLSKLYILIVHKLKPKKIILFDSRGKGVGRYNFNYDLAVVTKKLKFRRKRIIKEKLIDLEVYILWICFLN